VYTHHEASTSLKISEPGTLHALAYCNIHGLWAAEHDSAHAVLNRCPAIIQRVRQCPR
jgi:hypothetical protein